MISKDEKIGFIRLFMSKDYRALVALITERQRIVERDICDKEVGAERKRGERDALIWLQNLPTSVAKELKDEGVDLNSLN